MKNTNQKPLKQHGDTPLMAALRSENDLTMIETLMRFGANPWVQDEGGRNAFFHAKIEERFAELRYMQRVEVLCTIMSSKLPRKRANNLKYFPADIIRRLRDFL